MVLMKSILKDLLKGVGWLLLTVGGLLFLFGGRAIHEFAHIDRLVAEMEGIVLAIVIGLLGYAAKSAAQNLEDDLSNENDSSDK